MEFSDLLAKEGIDPQRVLVMRHRPREPEFRKVLPWLAAERPDTYNAYQQTQTERVERAMQTVDYVASFIGHEAGKALFVGLYRRGAWCPLTYDEFWKIGAFQEMKAFGMQGFRGDRDSILWFDLDLLDFYAHWKGKLIIDWPGGERTWFRRAERNKFLIEAVLQQNMLDAAMPAWDELTLSWDELDVLPSRWKVALAEWRGIYLIFDESNGQSYVGSAYGDNNILGRWRNYAATGHGGNKELRERNPKYFRFSILQRVSPDLEPADVIRLEGTWKQRLHTRDFGMNEN